jgi:hypothetical protein
MSEQPVTQPEAEQTPDLIGAVENILEGYRKQLLAEVHAVVNGAKPNAEAPSEGEETELGALQREVNNLRKQLEIAALREQVSSVAEKHQAYPDLLYMVATANGVSQNREGKLVTQDGKPLENFLTEYLGTEQGSRLKKPKGRNGSFNPGTSAKNETPREKLYRALGLQ